MSDTPQIAADAVTVAYVHDGFEVAYSWHMSFTKMLMWDSHHHQRVIRGKFATTKGGTDGLCQARNRIVRDWLAGSDAPWLFFVDTDMAFAPDTVDRLVQAADPVDRPVVGGLCLAHRYDVSDGMDGFRPSIWPVLMDWSQEPGNTGFLPRLDYPVDTVTPVAGTGAACILIHRSVFERLREKHDDPNWSRWYSRLPSPNDPNGDLSEDFSFCLRLREAGIPVHIDTAVKTTHMKRVWLAEDSYLDARTRVTEQLASAAAEGNSLLPAHVDVAASVASVATNKHVRADGMLKLGQDLDRYRQIIEATQPEVIVETGTRTGASARWFAEQGVDVITVDIDQKAGSGRQPHDGRLIDFMSGDATNPDVVRNVTELVAGRRCMVSLDSDHSAAHVAREIELYGPLVSSGCYLVVEDTVFGYAPQQIRELHLPGQAGTPLDAVARHLVGNPQWSRDVAIERMSATTHHVAGWWMRNG
jgi:cephalosporin hydroxylase